MITTTRNPGIQSLKHQGIKFFAALFEALHLHLAPGIFKRTRKKRSKVFAFLKYVQAALLCIMVSACGSKMELQNFDYEAWTSDPNGCKGQRLQQLATIENNLDLFKGLNQNEVKDLLGKPDKNELYKRSQKFFVYHIGPSESCEQDNDAPSPYLSIRFNAMGLAKEVLIYED